MRSREIVNYWTTSSFHWECPDHPAGHSPYFVVMPMSPIEGWNERALA